MGCLMLSGGREDPLYPRPSEAEFREERYEPRSSVRPADPLPRVVSEDGRDGIGENFCQPPPLLLPLSRPVVEPPELPDLLAEPQFELPRVSARDGELFSGRPERWKPLFELLFPGLAPSRLFPPNPPFGRLTFEPCDCLRPNECDAVAVPPRAEKKC